MVSQWGIGRKGRGLDVYNHLKDGKLKYLILIYSTIPICRLISKTSDLLRLKKLTNLDEQDQINLDLLLREKTIQLSPS